MKVYFEQNTNTVVIENQERLFANTLIAEVLDGKISIRDKALNIIEVISDYINFQKEDGSPAGSSLQEVVDYLNSEFIKSSSTRMQSGVPYYDSSYLYAVFANSNSTWDVRRTDRTTFTENTVNTATEPTTLAEVQALF